MGIFEKFKSGFRKGSTVLQSAFSHFSVGGKISQEDLLEIEEAFYLCDFGPDTAEEVLQAINTAFRAEKELKGEEVVKIARVVLSRILEGSEGVLNHESTASPQIVCLVGVNGSGKTTTCAKLGHRLKESGSSVLIGACDTFRAAATEQLKDWGTRLNLEVISGHHGSDAAAVAFDAYSSALAKECTYLLLDTAGRLHVKENLMDELAKLKRVLQKREPEAPHQSWLVVDGSTGTNGLAQAKVFHQKFGLNGLVVTKLDGTSKGGALVSIYRELGIPIYYLGLGEQPDDLQAFSVEAYLDSLLPTSMVSTSA